MATFTDVERTCKQECIFSLTGIKERIWNPNKVVPPGQYIHNTRCDFTIGDHFGNFARIKVKYVTTSTGAFIPYTWDVYVYATVEVSNGHSGATTVIQDVLIDSQTGIADTVDYYDVDTQFDGTYLFECTSQIKYDITETATAVLDLPSYTKYKQYERSKAGANAKTKVVIAGITTEQSANVVTPQTTTYKFRADITEFRKNGALAGQSQLLIQTMTTNQRAVPDYNHNNVVNTNFYAKHRGSNVDCKNIGTDDAFGDPAQTDVTMDSRVKLEHKVKMLGKINAYDISYPQSLQFKLTGLDNGNGTNGSRTITRTGSYEENDTFVDYDIESNVGGTVVSTGPNETVPTLIKTEIIGSTLTTNGDDSKYTRFPMRAWPFPAVSMYLKDEQQITAGGTTNTRSFSPTQNFNSYRYLEIEVKSNTGTNQTDTLTLTCQPNADSKTWPFSVSSTTYVRKRFDLMIPDNKTTGIDDQDDPFPRKHPTDNTYASQERENKAWYGVSRVSQLAIANSNITLGNIYLVADPESEYSDFVIPPEYYVKVQNDSNTGVTYLGRRIWCQSTSGRHEEEFDVLNTNGTKAIATIDDFVTRVNGNHLGWVASTSTASGSGRASYVNSISGYASWIGQITWRADSGGGTIQKDYINVCQNQNKPDADVFGMTIFDEFDTTELIPDYPDPFGVYKDDSYPLLTIPSYSILRGKAFGTIVTSSKTPAVGETVDLILTSDSSNRGTDNTNSIGVYNTGSPKGLSYKNHKIKYVAGAQEVSLTPLYAGKKYRAAFYPGIPSGANLSADLSNFYQHLITFVDGGVVRLIITNTFDFSTFNYIVTDISSAVNAQCKWRPSTSNNEIVLNVQTTAASNNIKRYVLNNLEGVGGVATTLGTGTSPALAIDENGNEFHFWRVAGTSGDIKQQVISPTGTTIRAAATVVTGNVADKGIAAYVRNNDIYLVYSHSTNGITVVRSYDYGGSYS